MGRSVLWSSSEDRLNQTQTETLQHQVTQGNIVVTTSENGASDPKGREMLKSEYTVHIEVST